MIVYKAVVTLKGLKPTIPTGGAQMLKIEFSEGDVNKRKGL
jgi:hypothetical protein